MKRLTDWGVVLLTLTGAAGVVALSVLEGCRRVPITERRQLVLVPERQEIEMGQQLYAELLQQYGLSDNEQATAVIRRVGQRIAAVTGRPDYRWEFHLLRSDVPNAFCLPGGKVAFFEGILPVCQNEAGVAVVMSHEVAHALARHGAERMSQGALVRLVGQVVQLAMREEQPLERESVELAYGVVSKYGVLLPYSRKHEAEADAIGLRLMARAGYDPSEAVRFWQRFADYNGQPQVPEFFSTHPSDQRRAERLRELLPQAQRLYAQTTPKYGLGEPLQLAHQLGQSAVVPAKALQGEHTSHAPGAGQETEKPGP